MRADQLLVARGLFASRAQARAAIEAGTVQADGALVNRAAQMLDENAAIEAAPAHPYVSRGGMKLAAALAHFGFKPAGKICLDVGASTGGFTDALLRGGAQRVYAVDVGTDQLHGSLRSRGEVVVLEQTDIRNARLPEPVQLIAIDVSFISLNLVLPAVTTLAAPEAEMIALIKPQFEAGRRRVKKGVVRDPIVQSAACDEIAAASTALGWRVLGIVDSPIRGGDGNREFLLGACLARA
jgi:23S rRNA (cytidine1920-2'-O)/16S rRNA (cytidine1409-2'-O)-methyltransferase